MEITSKSYLSLKMSTLRNYPQGWHTSYEMIAAAMEGKRLGLHQKSLMVVPNHLTEQMGQDFLKLYPNANILVATKNDFTKENRQKLCAKISTGDFDAIIIGHSQITLKETLAYIANPKKTDNGRLVFGFMCSENPTKATKDFEEVTATGTGRSTVLAQHFIVSFKPGEITPERAIEIGKELCTKFLNDEYQYLLTVHVDKEKTLFSSRI